MSHMSYKMRWSVLLHTLQMRGRGSLGNRRMGGWMGHRGWGVPVGGVRVPAKSDPSASGAYAWCPCHGVGLFGSFFPCFLTVPWKKGLMDFIQNFALICMYEYLLILDWKVEPLLSGHFKNRGLSEILGNFHNLFLINLLLTIAKLYTYIFLEYFTSRTQNLVLLTFFDQAKSEIVVAVVSCFRCLFFCVNLLFLPDFDVADVVYQTHSPSMSQQHQQQQQRHEATTWRRGSLHLWTCVVVVTFVEITSATSALLQCGNSFFFFFCVQPPESPTSKCVPQPTTTTTTSSYALFCTQISDLRSCGHFTCLV